VPPPRRAFKFLNLLDQCADGIPESTWNVQPRRTTYKFELAPQIGSRSTFAKSTSGVALIREIVAVNHLLLERHFWTDQYHTAEPHDTRVQLDKFWPVTSRNTIADGLSGYRRRVKNIRDAYSGRPVMVNPVC